MKLSIFLLLGILIAGCREDIITPDNPDANVNEIVKEKTPNTFSFSVNAENMSFNVEQYPDLNFQKTRLSFTISDYSSGETSLKVYNRSNLLYDNEFKRNLNGNFVDFTGTPPTTLQIRCSDFTGKLRIHLRKMD